MCVFTARTLAVHRCQQRSRRRPLMAVFQQRSSTRPLLNCRQKKVVYVSVESRLHPLQDDAVDGLDESLGRLANTAVVPF